MLPWIVGRPNSTPAEAEAGTGAGRIFLTSMHSVRNGVGGIPFLPEWNDHFIFYQLAYN